MAKKLTKAAFAVWVRDEANVASVLELIAGGLTLQKASLAVKQPYTCLHEYFHASPEALGRYEAARKAWADVKQDEALALADAVKAEKGAVAKAKLQIETRHSQAKAWNRERYGDKVQVERPSGAPSDAALLGFASELLSFVKEQLPAVPRVIEPGQVLEGSSCTPPVALPAPAERSEKAA